jgi:hypothetical protein
MVYRKLHSTYSMLNGLCYGISLQGVIFDGVFTYMHDTNYDISF